MKEKERYPLLTHTHSPPGESPQSISFSSLLSTGYSQVYLNLIQALFSPLWHGGYAHKHWTPEAGDQIPALLLERCVRPFTSYLIAASLSFPSENGCDDG